MQRCRPESTHILRSLICLFSCLLFLDSDIKTIVKHFISSVFTKDNGTLLNKLEEVLKGSSYMELIAKFWEKRDGRGVW